MRALTRKEKAQIKTAKKEVNKILEARHHSRIYYGHYPWNGKRGKNNRSEIQFWKKQLLIYTTPVVVTQDGRSICLDHTTLRKLNRSLDRRKYFRRSYVSEKRDAVIINFRRRGEKHVGTIELRALPAEQAELLEGSLPVIELE